MEAAALPVSVPEPDALEVDLHVTYRNVRAFFIRRLPPELRQEADDLVQETLIATILAADRSSGPLLRSPSAYVLGIARRKAADLFRGTQRAQRREAPTPVEQLGQDLGMEARLAADQEAARLRSALAFLPPLERQLLHLRYETGMGNAEAARLAGLSPEEASRLRYRALARLRRILAPPHRRREARRGLCGSLESER